MPYGEKLNSIKSDRKLTNSQIHEICDVPLSTVIRMFDKKNVSGGNFETIVDLARGLNFSLDWLAGLKQLDKSSDDLSQQLKEKDTKIEQLIEVIKTLRDDNRTLRDDNKALREDNTTLRKVKNRAIKALTILTASLLLWVIIDIANGHFGCFRY